MGRQTAERWHQTAQYEKLAMQWQILGVIVEGIQEEMATNWAEEPQEEGYHKTVHSII